MGKTILLGLLLLGCGGSTEYTREGLCSDGLLVIRGPTVSRILAFYPEAPPPDRRVAHLSDPPMRLVADEPGFNRVFVPDQPEVEAENFEIRSWVAATGEPLCPVNTQVERE